MSKNYYVSLYSIYSPDKGYPLKINKPFYIEDNIVFIYSIFSGEIEKYADVSHWLTKLVLGKHYRKSTVEEFNILNDKDVENSSKKDLPKSATSNYQSITTTVSEDIRFKLLDSHKYFNRPLSIPIETQDPKKPVIYLDTPTGKKEINLKSGHIVETAFKIDAEKQFAPIDIPKNREAVSVNTEGLFNFKAKDIDGVTLIDSIEVNIQDKRDYETFDEQWEKYINLPRKTQKLEYISTITYPGILKFLIKKTEELLQKSDSESEELKLSNQIYKMHLTLIDEMRIALRRERKEL